MPMIRSRAPYLPSGAFQSLCQTKLSLNSLIAGHAPSATRQMIAKTTATPIRAASPVSP